MTRIACIALGLLLPCILWAAGTVADIPPDAVLLKKDGITVTMADFQAYLDGIPKKDRDVVVASPQQFNDFTEGLWVYKVLAHEARDKGADKDPLVKAKEQYGADRALATAYLESLEATAKPSDYEEQAREQYLTEKDKYKTPAKISITQILISTVGPDGHDKAEAKKIAEDVRKQLVADPSRLQELEEKYSEDPTKDKYHGKMTDITRGMAVKSFENAAFALKNPGDISPVVQTPAGFHVIYLNERTEPQVKSFDEVKDKLIAQFKAANARKARQAHVEHIREDVKGRYFNEQAMKKIVTALNKGKADEEKARAAQAAELNSAGQPEPSGSH